MGGVGGAGGTGGTANNAGSGGKGRTGGTCNTGGSGGKGGGGGGGGGATPFIDKAGCVVGVLAFSVFVFCAIKCVETAHTNSNIIVFFILSF